MDWVEVTRTGGEPSQGGEATPLELRVGELGLPSMEGTAMLHRSIEARRCKGLVGERELTLDGG